MTAYARTTASWTRFVRYGARPVFFREFTEPASSREDRHRSCLPAHWLRFLSPRKSTVSPSRPRSATCIITTSRDSAQASPRSRDHQEEEKSDTALLLSVLCCRSFLLRRNSRMPSVSSPTYCLPTVLHPWRPLVDPAWR